MSRGNKQKPETESRSWQILNFLTDLKNLVEEKATKIGDHLISQELKEQEKRQKKLDQAATAKKKSQVSTNKSIERKSSPE